MAAKLETNNIKFALCKTAEKHLNKSYKKQKQDSYIWLTMRFVKYNLHYFRQTDVSHTGSSRN